MRTRSVARVLRCSMLTLVAASAAGCTGWQAQSPGAATLAATQLPQRMRLTLHDGSRVILDAPTLRNDSILGFEGGAGAARRIHGIHLPDVAKVETIRTSAWRTGLIVAGVSLLVFGLVAMQDFANSFSAGF